MSDFTPTQRLAIWEKISRDLFPDSFPPIQQDPAGVTGGHCILFLHKALEHYRGQISAQANITGDSQETLPTTPKRSRTQTNTAAVPDDNKAVAERVVARAPIPPIRSDPPPATRRTQTRKKHQQTSVAQQANTADLDTSSVAHPYSDTPNRQTFRNSPASRTEDSNQGLCESRSASIAGFDIVRIEEDIKRISELVSGFSGDEMANFSPDVTLVTTESAGIRTLATALSESNDAGWWTDVMIFYQSAVIQTEKCKDLLKLKNTIWKLNYIACFEFWET